MKKNYKAFKFILFLVFLITLQIVLLVTGGHALIPPLSEKELEESDIIIEGYVLGVLKTGVTGTDKWDKHHYNAFVRIDKIYKGDLPVNTGIVVRWTGFVYTGKEKDHVGGPSGITLYPGERAKLFLKYSSQGYYYAERWNSAETISGGNGKVPEKPGEYVSGE